MINRINPGKYIPDAHVSDMNKWKWCDAFYSIRFTHVNISLSIINVWHPRDTHGDSDTSDIRLDFDVFLNVKVSQPQYKWVLTRQYLLDTAGHGFIATYQILLQCPHHDLTKYPSHAKVSNLYFVQALISQNQFQTKLRFKFWSTAD